MRGLTGFLFRREVVLAAFLILKLAAVIVGGVTHGTIDAWGIGILALATYTAIAWFAYQRRALSVWAITIIMLYEGSGALIAGLDQFDTAPALTVIGTAMATYLFLGALSVFSSRRRGQ